MPSLSLARSRPLSWRATAVDAVGTGTAGVTNGATGAGATVFRTGVATTPGAQVGTIPKQIGGVRRSSGQSIQRRPRGPWPMIATGAVKTATSRAAEAIEAAELMFTNEMGATLNLSPA